MGFEKNTVKSFRNVKRDMETLKNQIEGLNRELGFLLSLLKIPVAFPFLPVPIIT